MDKREAQLSKYLSLLLRHQSEKVGLQLDASGWVSVSELISACEAQGKPLTLLELKSVVANNDKKRFEFSEDGIKIRASQGHSLDVDLGYEAASPPERLFHGTASRFVDSIKKQGLMKQQRHHVHLADG